MIIVLILCIVLVRADYCDRVVRGSHLASGMEKTVYEARLNNTDVEIKEVNVDYWRSMAHRFNSYLRLYQEYKIFKSLESDYPNRSMKVYAFCERDVPFYIMERGDPVVQDEMHRSALQRMLQRNTNATRPIITVDLQWNQLVKRSGELYIIDVTMDEVYNNVHIDLNEYYRWYEWNLYCKPGETEIFSKIGYPLNTDVSTMECSRQSLALQT